jgi:hypothetical protein
MKGSMFASFSTFADGSTACKLNTSDFSAKDVNGDPALELIVDPSSGETQAIIHVDFAIPPDESSYCFMTAFDQHSKYGTVVYRKPDNGKWCGFYEPSTIYISEKCPFEHTLNNFVEDGANDGNHEAYQTLQHPMSVFATDAQKVNITAVDKYNCINNNEWKPKVKLITSWFSRPRAGEKYSVKIHNTKFANVITVVKVEMKSVSFTSDHNLMTDYNSNFGGSGGNGYVPRGWVKEGANNPVSHTRNSKVSVDAGVFVSLAGLDCTLTAWSIADGLNFPNTLFRSSGANQPLSLTSSDSLANKVAILNDKINWGIFFADGGWCPLEESGPHKMYVTCGTPGDGPTKKRIEYVCTKAQGKVSEEDCVKAIWDAVYNDTHFIPTANGSQLDGWSLLDGWFSQGGDCDNQARCMAYAVDMLGIRPAAVRVVIGSINAGAGNCSSDLPMVLQERIPPCAVHGTEKLCLNESGTWNAYQGCCVVAGKYYAISPHVQADNDYEMLKQLINNHGWQQFYYVETRSAFGSMWSRCTEPGSNPPVP